MSLISMSVSSAVLQTTVDLNIIAPYDTLGEKKGKKPCVLYLLHGIYGSHNSWVCNSNISRYVSGKNVLVVIPNMNNTFYVNNAHGIRYLDFMAHELPEIIGNTFSVSQKREDTFICGLSMGGYGAFRIAFEAPEKFACAASLSGALDICEISKNGGMDGFDDTIKNSFKINFGENGVAPGDENDLFYLSEKTSHLKVKPKLLQYCGKQDFLYKHNQNFKNHIQKLDFEYNYYESDGIHDWNFWDDNIQKVLCEIEKINTSI